MDEIKLPKLTVPRPAEKPVTGLPSVHPEPVQEAAEAAPQHEVILPPDQIGSEKEPVKEPEPETVLFELRLTETGVITGSIPITWCVDRDWLLNHSRKELYVLLSVAPPESSGQTAEWRGWAKLSDMMAYVTFYRHGKNRILAWVTDSKEDIDKWMMRSREERGGWNLQAMSFPNHWDGDRDVCTYLLAKRWMEESSSYDLGPKAIQSHLDVDLPSGCFAPEPSEFEKKWVNFFFRNKAVDQCEFRRRRILAYTVQPIAFVLAVILFIVVTLCIQIFNLMIGKWTVWNNFFSSSAEIDRRIDFLTIKKFDPLSWLLIPVPWLMVAAFTLSKIKCLHFQKWFLLAPAYLLVIPIGFWLLVLAIVSIEKIKKWAEDRSPRIRAAKRAAKQKAEDEYLARMAIIRKAELETLELLLCSSGKRITTIKDLPKSKRTIKLRFQGVKARVCKPFAR
ncbi:hypothetical protein M0R72_00375 [Candidatus Pacearchaeota archaeon]|jgi:hypothetical protein|nr:hypothetical protein [Candidatus Pacearchaeota archaeon]